MSPDQQSKQPEGAPRPANAETPADWSEEKRAEVERMGAEAAAALLKRAANPGPMRPPRAAPAFVPLLGKCDAHGEYSQNFLDAEGVERWNSPGCPSCARQAAAERLMARAAIAPRFAHCTFDSYRVTSDLQRETFEQCRRYAEDFAAMRARGTCLILRGRPGTGKNHLAVAITRAVLAMGMTAMHATANEVIRRVRDAWNPASKETEDDVYRKFAELDLLVVDEIGRHYQPKAGGESIEIFNVIDARYRLVKPAIVISNLDKESMKAAMGEAAYDRLREGGARIANFDWASARGDSFDAKD